MGATIAESEVVVVKAADVWFGLYASNRYVAARPAIEADPMRHRMIRYGGAAWEPGSAWLGERLPSVPTAVTLEDMPSVRGACGEGVGLAVLPHFFAVPAGLKCVADGCDKAAIYVAAHPDLRRVARVATVVRWLNDSLKERLAELRRRRAP
jgi:DNA-binding transcriptional LysR family regulator